MTQLADAVIASGDELAAQQRLSGSTREPEVSA
jgi:hypothetical protein